MAQKLKKFEFRGQGRRKKANKEPDWDKWLDGGVYRLKQGEDFDGDPREMADQVRKKASRTGKKALVNTEATVVVQATNGEE